MIEGFRQIREVQSQADHPIDLRTAAMLVAIDKIAAAYQQKGIFP